MARRWHHGSPFRTFWFCSDNDPYCFLDRFITTTSPSQFGMLGSSVGMNSLIPSIFGICGNIVVRLENVIKRKKTPRNLLWTKYVVTLTLTPFCVIAIISVSCLLHPQNDQMGLKCRITESSHMVNWGSTWSPQKNCQRSPIFFGVLVSHVKGINF